MDAPALVDESPFPPPPERVSWRFPAACTALAAALVGLSRFFAPPDRGPELGAGSLGGGDLAAAPAGDELPVPFLDLPPPPSAFLPASAPPPARVHAGAPTVSGRLPAAVVSRVLRGRRAALQRCYQDGLRNNPNLQGRVTTRLVIGRDGAVSAAGNGGSDLPDAAVVSCVMGAFRGASFPAPEAGLVTVIHPVYFAPG